MPIYAYRCEACGHAKDVLQKISDPVLSICPACGADAFRKQLTAAGFQLKGSGWYATDFRNGSKPPADAAKPGDGAAAKPADAPASGSKDATASPAPATAPSTGVPAAAPASKPGGSPAGA